MPGGSGRPRRHASLRRFAEERRRLLESLYLRELGRLRRDQWPELLAMAAADGLVTDELVETELRLRAGS